MIKKILDKKEWWLAGLVILVVTLISLYPAIWAGLNLDDSSYFFGSNMITTPDYPVYLSFIEQARQGEIIFTNLFTTEFQSPVIFSPLWLSLGVLAKTFGGSAAFWFYLAKVLVGIIFLFFLYHFISKFFLVWYQRLIAFVLVAFSSGLGTLVIPREKVWDIITVFYKVPADLWIPESNTFLSIYHSALFSLSQLLIVLIFYLFLEKLNLRRYLALALVVLILGILHPYDLVIVGLVPTLYLIFDNIRKRKIDMQKFWAWMVIGFAALPAGIYYILITRSEWVIAQWAIRNWTPSPPIFSYLFGYGLVLIFATLGVALIIKNKKDKFYFLIIWAVSSGALLYIPSTIQRRFSNGLHIVLAILAAVAVVYLFEKLRKSMAIYFVLAILILGFFFSNLTMIMEDQSSYTQTRFPGVWPSEYYDAMQWLKDNSSSDEAIIADVQIANLIPALTARKVYAGHGHQTVDFGGKRTLLQNWFWRTNNDDEAKLELLRSNSVKYLWYSEYEQQWGNFDPAIKEYLQEVYSSDKVEIYKVMK